MLEQIKKLQGEKLDIQDIENEIDTSKNEEEFSHLRVHDQSLLMQSKKLNNDKKSLQERLEKFTNKEALINKKQ